MVSVHRKLNPIGIDKPIDVLQSKLEKSLGWSNVEIYGRVVKLISGNNTIPQAFKDGEYAVDVLTLERGSNKVFFIDEGNATDRRGGSFSTTVKSVFMVDLSTIFPEVSHRADTEAQVHVLDILRGVGLFRDIEGVQTDIREIFKGYNLFGLKSEVLDVHPRHIFAVRSKVNYSLKSNIHTCCKP